MHHGRVFGALGGSMNHEHKHVVFRLGRDLFGLPIESVERILDAQPVTRLPRAPEIVTGVFELRGSTLAVVDLRRRFELPETEEVGQFVVVAQQSGPVAVRVDAVEGIVTIDDAQVDPNPEWMCDPQDDFVQGVAKSGERLVLVLRPESLVPKSVRDSLSAGLATEPERAELTLKKAA